eukprot:3917015-Amphidinium_carterae.1
MACEAEHMFYITQVLVMSGRQDHYFVRDGGFAVWSYVLRLTLQSVANSWCRSSDSNNLSLWLSASHNSVLEQRIVQFDASARRFVQPVWLNSKSAEVLIQLFSEAAE